jgi:hypothetical protein
VNDSRPSGGISGDDPNVPDSEIVYRWLSKPVNCLVKDEATGESRVSSMAFAPDSDGLSVYRHTVLEQEGLTPITGLVRADSNVIISLNVGDIRSRELGIRDDANPPDVMDPEHPRHKAHALVVGWDGLGKKARIRRQQALARMPSVTVLHSPS